MGSFKKFALTKRLFAKILIIVSLVVIDLVTKSFCATYFTLGNSNVEILGGFITFTYLENTGAAFGSFSNGTIFLTILSFVFVVMWVVYDIYNNRQTRMYTYSYTLIIAGAVGNLIDRLFLGYVRDFLKFSIFGFVCNFADICITLGMILWTSWLIIEIVKDKRKNNDTRDNTGKSNR